MIRLVWSTINARRASFAGTLVALAFAIALGTMTAVLIDSSQRAVPATNRFAAADIVLSGVRVLPLDSDDENEVELGESLPLPASTLETVRMIDGVMEVTGDLTFYAQLVDADGEAITGRDGANSHGHSWSSAGLTPYTMRAGHAPSTDDEVVIDGDLAKRGGFAIGSVVTILTEQMPRTYRVAGIAGPPHGDALSTQAAIFFTAAEANRLAGAHGTYDAIGVFVADGQSVSAVRAAIKSRIDPQRVRILTGAKTARADAPDVSPNFDDLTAMLGTMAGLAGFISIFIVSSTFAFSVLQRTREIALLRTIGATPRQIRLMIMSEALVVAIVAGLIGVAGGLLATPLVAAILRDRGLAPAEFEPTVRWFLMLIVVGSGLLVAQIAVFAAARRGSKIRGIEALREASIQSRPLTPGRLLIGTISLIGGIVLVTTTLQSTGDDAIGFAFLVVMILTVAAAALGPLLVLPFIVLAGRSLRLLTHATGLLAERNSRTRLRTVASAASPMVLSIAFICALIFIQGTLTQATVEQTRRAYAGSLVVTAANAPGLPSGIVGEVQRLPHVAAASGLMTTQVGIKVRDMGDTTYDTYDAAGVDAATIGDALDLGVDSGDFSDLRGNTIAISRSMADAQHWRVGQTLHLYFSNGDTGDLTVVAIYRQQLVLGDFLLPQELARQHTAVRLINSIVVRPEPGAPSTFAREEIDGLRTTVPTISVITADQHVAGVKEAADQNTRLAYLIFSVVLVYTAIAIVNTLMMATAERVREFALLRLVGATRRQIMRMVGWEATIIVLAGLGIGLAIAAVPLVAATTTLYGHVVWWAPPLDTSVVVLGGILLGYGASFVPAILALRPNAIAVISEA